MTSKTLKLSGNMKVVDISKEMKRKLDMLPGMLDKAHKHFIPQVMRQSGMTDTSRYQIAFIEAMANVDGLLFEMQIDLEGMTCYELNEMLPRMDAFCMWEPTSQHDLGFSHNGYTFILGDGDDTGAVYMRKGKLCVWVRGFKE